MSKVSTVRVDIVSRVIVSVVMGMSAVSKVSTVRVDIVSTVIVSVVMGMVRVEIVSTVSVVMGMARG